MTSLDSNKILGAVNLILRDRRCADINNPALSWGKGGTAPWVGTRVLVETAAEKMAPAVATAVVLASATVVAGSRGGSSGLIGRSYFISLNAGII